MKLIIAGSRTFTDYQLLCQTLAPEKHRITQVITGSASGADRLGIRWAVSHSGRLKGFPAGWQRCRKSAGVRRSFQMAQAGDLLLALCDGRCAGTRHMISCNQRRSTPDAV